MSLLWWGGGWGGGSRCGHHKITHLGWRTIASAWRGRNRHRVERLQVSSYLWASLNSATLLLWWLRLPPQASHLQSSSLPPVHSGCLLTGNHSPLPGSALPTPRFRTQPLSASEDTLSGCVGRAGVCTLRTGLTLSSTLVAVFSFRRERGSPSVATELPPVRGFPGCKDLCSLQILTGFCWSHPSSFPHPFPPSLSCPTWLSRTPSCPFRCPSSSAHVPQGSENFSASRCILDAFVERDELHVFRILCHLDSFYLRIRLNLAKCMPILCKL